MSWSTWVNNKSRLFGIKIGRTVSSLGNKLAVYGIEKKEYSISGNKIFFKLFNIKIPVERALPLLEGYHNAAKLLNKCGAEFSVDEQGYLNIKFNGIQYKISDEEELFILCEVFLEGSYNLTSPTNKPIALIDIGMNVGITSLFYAAQSKVTKIFSFEPFSPTYNLALHNLSLNKNISGKVVANNFGLAKDQGTLIVPYSLTQKGRMGLDGLPKKTDKVMNVSKQEIFLKPVNDQFLSIKEKTKENFIVCKIDCEGAEYEIIDSLSAAKLLDLPDVYFIEWHFKSPQEIITKLVNANFNVIGTTFQNPDYGMIYAVKNPISGILT